MEKQLPEMPLCFTGVLIDLKIHSFSTLSAAVVYTLICLHVSRITAIVTWMMALLGTNASHK